MYIKTITIQGFRSYLDQTYVEPFSPKHNVIVGRNGSGKSNFFLALQFVLSDKYANLRPEDREKLLHEGTGRAVISGFVEIVLDNKDGRLPIDKDEVTIRRTIGIKKDEFRIDNKSVTQREIVSLLESAGFSRSNPYYIVQQGKVSALTNLSGAQRLALLKEVAGTKVYDERREESLKIMGDTDTKIVKIDETIEYIDDRLKELEKEKEELRDYQKYDRLRRSIEYVIYDKELVTANERLEALEKSRHELHTEASALNAERNKVTKAVKDSEIEIRRITLQIADQIKERELLENERREYTKSKAKLQLEVQDLETYISGDNRTRNVASREMQELEQEIASARASIDTIEPQLEESARREQELSDRLTEAERRLTELYSKQGRRSRFKSAAERDDWIREEINERQSAIRADEQQINTLQSEIEKLTSDIVADQQAIAQHTSQFEAKKAILERYNSEYQTLKAERDEKAGLRKDLWRKQADTEKQLQKTREETARAERRLESTMSKSISTGLTEVKRICREHRIQGVCGTIIELFDCSSDIMTAVEITAGSSLFHVVVETDEVASQIIDIMNRQRRGGRVTFMPLNQMRPFTTPLEETQNARPMINMLTFDPKYRAAFDQIFGKTLITRNLEVASQLAKEKGLNCITLNGDQVNKNSVLTGGFYDDRYSRLDAMKSIKTCKGNLSRLNHDQQKTKTQLEGLDQEITTIIGRLQKLETSIHQTKSTITQMTSELRTLQAKIKSEQETLSQNEKSLAILQTTVRRSRDTISSLESELGTPLVVELSPAEQQELRTLNETTSDLKRQLVDAANQKLELQTQKRNFENTLNTHLLPRNIELRVQIQNVEISGRDTQIENARSELAKVNENISSITDRQKQLEENIERNQKLLRQKKSNLDDTMAAEEEKSRELVANSNKLEKLLNRKRILLEKKEDCIRQIRELGTLPSDYATYQNLSRPQLMAKLHKNNEKLKQYSHVNKKALDQYVQFSEQRDQLVEKKKELDESSKAIQKLIKVLDQRKDEAIERTIKAVNQHFSTVFSELVPGGHASLVLQTRAQRSAEQLEEEEEEEETPSTSSTATTISAYRGVAIRVSFTGTGETQTMQQLSGGQKSLVALALIFAIQRSDPAPIYLFDEIDAELDAAHRTSVAEMIERQAESTGAQFITATFKREMVEHADQFYGITYRNKVSRVARITQADALDVLHEEEMMQQQQQPEQSDAEAAASHPSESVDPMDTTD